MVLAVLLSLQAETRASYAKRYSYLSRVQNEDYRSWYGAKLRVGVAPDKVSRTDVEAYPDPDVLVVSLDRELEASVAAETAIGLFETQFRSHVSTRSQHKGVDSWMPRLRKYSGRTPRRHQLSKAQLAICRKVVRSILSSIPQEYRPEQLPFEEVFLEGSNSGLPHLQSDQRDIHADAAEEAAAIVAAIESIPPGRTPRWDMAPPTVLFLRTQEGGERDEAKARPIWGYPLVAKLVEASFQQPLEKALAAYYPHISWQDGQFIGEQISSLFTRHRRRGFIHGMDFSRYDSTVHGEIIRVIFEEIGAYFGREKLFAWIARYFTEVPILVPLGVGELHIKNRSKGVPSGSPFTSPIDSIANICYSVLVGNDEEDVFVLGDDKVEYSRLDGPILARRYANLGLSVSRIWTYDCATEIITVYERDGDVGSMSYTATGSVKGYHCVEYLSHLWTWDNRVVGSTFRCLNNTLRAERWKGHDWYPIDELGALAQRIENVKDHPWLDVLADILFDEKEWMTLEYVEKNLAEATERVKKLYEFHLLFEPDPQVLLRLWRDRS
jgi:hypothetical protein